ncbi:MAG: zinc ribbon domain-containing protein [Methanomassiliicoccales archaeon]
MLGGRPSDENKESGGKLEFDCPECGTHIVGQVSKCPKCGVEFVIEEVSEFECPECGTTVPADITKCPKCGAIFEMETAPESSVAQAASSAVPGAASTAAAPGIATPELVPSVPAETPEEIEIRKQFPLLVEEVKPLLSLASEYGIDAAEGRRYIDKAVRVGRQRDVVSAVKFVKQCLESVRSAIDERIARDLDYLDKLAEVAKKTGSDPTAISQAIANVKARNEAGDFAGALAEAKVGRTEAERITGKYVEANEICDALERLIQNSERFYIDVRDSRKLLNEARDAGQHGDWSMMGILARKGREELAASLPEVLKGELKKAKGVLLDAKAEGKDVSALVKILKDAGVALKRGDQEESLERLIEFKTEAKHL